MEIILNCINNKTCLTVNNQSSYNLTDINAYLRKLPKDFHHCVLKDGNMYLRANGYSLILMNYKKNIQDYAYGYIINSVNSNITIINREKIKNVNKKRLIAASLVLTTIICAKVGYDVKKTDNINSEIEIAEVSNMEMPAIDVNVEIAESVVNIPEFEDINIETPQPVIMYSSGIEDTKTFDSKFTIGNKMDEYTNNLTNNFINNGNFESIKKYAEMYGIDPYLLLALATSETGLDHVNTIPGGNRFNGYGIGIMQIESTNIGNTVSTMNYQTNETDSITITPDNVIDYDTNVKIGSIMFKNCLDKYKGNIYLTIQSYNYGVGMMDRIINMYASELGITDDEVMNNYDDTGWMKYVTDVHNNPKKYISGWQFDTYGCDFYVESVLGYYTGNMISNSLQR